MGRARKWTAILLALFGVVVLLACSGPNYTEAEKEVLRAEAEREAIRAEIASPDGVDTYPMTAENVQTTKRVFNGWEVLPTFGDSEWVQICRIYKTVSWSRENFEKGELVNPVLDNTLMFLDLSATYAVTGEMDKESRTPSYVKGFCQYISNE